MRVQAVRDGFDAGVRDELSVFRGLPYPPLGPFVQLSNVSPDLRLHSLVPRERAVAPPVEQLIHNSIPSGDRHSPLIRSLPESLTDHTRGGLKLRNHAVIGERQSTGTDGARGRIAAQ